MSLKRQFITYSFQEEGKCYAGRGHMKKHQGQSRGREEIGGNRESLLQFPQEGTDEVGQASL